MTGVAHEATRADGEGVAFAFGDLETGRFGLARAGLGAVFADGELAGRSDQVSVETVDSGQAWRVSSTGAGAAFELEFAALGEPVGFSAATAGLPASEQLCHVTGTVTAAGRAGAIDCLGQCGRAPGEAKGVAFTRSLGAWLGPDEAVLAHAVRPAGDAGHDAETLEVFIVEGETPVALAVADPRLTTQYDPDGRHVRAGLELWVGEEDDYARRVAGEVVCAATFDLGTARLDCAFLQWRLHGHEGAGFYDVIRAT